MDHVDNMDTIEEEFTKKVGNDVLAGRSKMIDRGFEKPF